jgi:hypothetical protein
MMNYRNLFGSCSFAALALLAACVSTQPAQQPVAPPQTPQAQAVSAPNAQPSALSYGTVTATVQKGKTTQADLLQMFGGPNISTTDSDGVETWVYERSVTQTDVASNSRSSEAAAKLGLFFKSVELGASGSTSQSAAASSTTTSIRSLTVIVKFNQDKTVKDYSARASYF